jgi:tRNA pseudouridine38-40 synthase
MEAYILMNHICLAVTYDGTNYHGFQSQPQKNTIQDKLQEALFRVTGENVKIVGSGRTDAGVHARSQYVDFYVSANVPLDKWCLAMNCWLPNDIVVKAVYHVPDDFNARKSTCAKTYRYSINYGRIADVFHNNTQYHFPRRLNIDQMILASKHLVGEHDFTSFASAHNVRRSNVRSITDITFSLEEHSFDPKLRILDIFITGSGFLQHMVRIIIGTLLDVGVGKKSVQDVIEILKAKNRLLAGPTAPPSGLMLWEVFYPEKYMLNLETYREQ